MEETGVATDGEVCWKRQRVLLELMASFIAQIEHVTTNATTGDVICWIRRHDLLRW